MDFSPIQIGIVLLIVLIVFGPKRLPELGHAMGKGIREFKESITGSGDDDDDDDDHEQLADPDATESADAEVVTEDKV